MATSRYVGAPLTGRSRPSAVWARKASPCPLGPATRKRREAHSASAADWATATARPLSVLMSATTLSRPVLTRPSLASGLATLSPISREAPVGDPNLAALRAWVRKMLSGTTHRHFRLARDSDVETLTKEYNDER